MPKMTLLEFVISKYIGPPTSRPRHGESTWDCPMCGHSRFHSLPHKPQFKDRYKCWSCGFHGDLQDWMKEQHPTEDYGQRLDRIEELRTQYHEYEKTAKFAPASPVAGIVVAAGEDSRDVGRAWGEIEELPFDNDKALDLLVQVRDVCQRNRVSVESVVDYWLGFVKWTRSLDVRHRGVCRDPKCDWKVCREARKKIKKVAIKKPLKRKGREAMD